MKAISIEQLYATLKSISRSVFKHISKVQESANKAQETAANAQETAANAREIAANAQETAANAREIAAAKMETTNPTATGYFEMNRDSDATHIPGHRSFSMNSKATGNFSHAEGENSSAGGIASHAEGGMSTAAGGYCHAEGRETYADGLYTHAEGFSCKTGVPAGSSMIPPVPAIQNDTNRKGAHAEGYETRAFAFASHAEGSCTLASTEAPCSHVEGCGTRTYIPNQHVQGRYNAYGPSVENMAHIVGNGYVDANGNERRKNAHTLDWDGNAWYAGTVEGTGMIVRSTTTGSNKRFMITVDDSGVISATEVEE